jgi:hypothetical protein
MRFRTILGRRVAVEEENLSLKAGADGLVREECWFCGSEVQFRPDETTGSDAAVVIVEPLGGGEATHGVCHASCAERAKGSLRL